jgi:hypothetical protein
MDLEQHDASLAVICHEAYAEALRQIEKWGEQNWPSLSPAIKHTEYDALAKRMRDSPNQDALRQVTVMQERSHRLARTRHYGLKPSSVVKSKVDRLLREQNCDWASILMEELSEAIEEGEWRPMRAELVQCMAVIASWIECGDRGGVPT